jgi:lipopolysaccharide transport system permease protein
VAHCGPGPHGDRLRRIWRGQYECACSDYTAGSRRMTAQNPKPSPAAASVGDSPQENYFGHEHITVIEPPGGFELVDARELWAYRELLVTLARRQIHVRYKQTILGASWAIVQPAMQMVVFTVLFGHMAKVPSQGFPYPVFVYSALLPWTYFTNAASAALGSLVGNSHLLTKVYFPRLIIPLAAVTAALVDFVVASSVLAGLMTFYGVAFTPQLLLLPLIVLGLVLAATGIGAGLGALNVSYRDLGYVMPFFMQLWLYATPVVYPASLVPESLRVVLRLNPLTGLIESFRACVLGQPLDPAALAGSLVVAVVLFAAGTLYFRAVERRFADVV